MKIYDISQEVFSCIVYPGDPQPEKQTLYSTEAGDLYNLTVFSMCAHNGTHIDAPFHFLHDGKTMDQMDLSHFVGDCYVARHEGDVTAADAEAILSKANGAERILIAGSAIVTAEAAANDAACQSKKEVNDIAKSTFETSEYFRTCAEGGFPSGDCGIGETAEFDRIL